MGTRADFYIGTGTNAEWLGSVGWDGYEWEEDPECLLMTAKTEKQFRMAVMDIARKRRDWTATEMGWPWPWENSKTTDIQYAFSDGQTKVFHWGGDESWPDMTHIKNVAMGKRSGLITITFPPCAD